MTKRNFLKTTGKALAVGAASTLAAPAVLAQSQKTFNFKMVTTWPPGFPILQESAEQFAKRLDEVTNGRVKVQVFAAGELVPPLGSFDAVSAGTVDIFHGAAFYWAGKVPAAQWMSAVPFGFNAQTMNAWYYSGGAKEIYEEMYKPFNLIPRLCGNSGVQMGGWYNKKIETMEDFKGLKMRIPGLGGKVVAKAGGSVVLLPAPEIFTSLERGVIDATEWVGPLLDERMGFDKAAKYYYYPGWHEPGTAIEVVFNAEKYNSLPKDLQAAVDAVAAETNLWTLSENETRTGASLEKFMKEGKVEVLRFPKEVMEGLRTFANEVMEEEAAKDAMSTKIHNSFKDFRQKTLAWNAVSERAYYEDIVPEFKK